MVVVVAALGKPPWNTCRGVLFVFLNAHQPWRHVKVPERKAARDFAHCTYELVDVHYPNAETVRVVFDNLSAHKPAAALPPRPLAKPCGALSFVSCQARELAQYGGN